MKSKRYIIILSIVAFLLLIPLLLMQFTDTINWNLTDFILAGALLLGAGLLFDLLLRKVRNQKLWIVLGILILIALILVWAELGVGIFGTPFGGN